MINTIKRVIKNIKWAIFNHPPTRFTQVEKQVPCSYCHTNDHPIYNFCEVNFAICEGCMGKVADNILSEFLSESGQMELGGTISFSRPSPPVIT